MLLCDTVSELVAGPNSGSMMATPPAALFVMLLRGRNSGSMMPILLPMLTVETGETVNNGSMIDTAPLPQAMMPVPALPLIVQLSMVTGPLCCKATPCPGLSVPSATVPSTVTSCSVALAVSMRMPKPLAFSTVSPSMRDVPVPVTRMPMPPLGCRPARPEPPPTRDTPAGKTTLST